MKKLVKVSVVLILIAVFVLMCMPFSGEYVGFVTDMLLTALTSFSNLFGFSLYWVFLAAMLLAVVWAVVVIAKNMKRRTWRNFFIRLFQMACVVFVLFSTTIGFSYRKKSIYETLQFDTTYTQQDIDNAGEYLVQQLNKNLQKVRLHDGMVIFDEEMTFEYFADIVQQEVWGLDFDFLNGNKSKIKKMPLGQMFFDQGLQGFFFPFFGETNVADIDEEMSTPVVMVHELLHSRGMMNEGEVTFLSQYVAMHSENNILQFLGSFYAVLDFFYYARFFDQELFDKLWYQVDDFKLATEISRQVMERSKGQQTLLHKVNDAYLKLNFVESGNNSYYEGILGWILLTKNRSESKMI